MIGEPLKPVQFEGLIRSRDAARLLGMSKWSLRKPVRGNCHIFSAH
jgi:hypothetical protein